MRHAARVVLASFAMLVTSIPAAGWAASPWPSEQPITWVVGFTPGGSVDVITRALAQQVGKELNQSVVVENKPGGAGGIALAAVARARPDGYTLVTAAGPILHAPHVPKVGAGLTAVAPIAQGAVVLVGPASGPKDFAALSAAIKANPGKFAYASSGIGTGQHIAGEMLNQAMGADMVHVPYKGGGQAVVDVMGGVVPLAFLGVSSVYEHVRSGKLTAYAVTTAQRAEASPEVPTLREAGLSNFELPQWYVVAVPEGTPQDVADKLRAATAAAVKTPEIQRLLTSNSLSSVDASIDANALVKESMDRAESVAREANIRLD